MRRNAIGEAYCTDSDEVCSEMDSIGFGPNDCNADIVFDDEDGWIAEIKANQSGDTVCYVEGFKSRNALCEMLVFGVGKSNRDVNYI